MSSEFKLSRISNDPTQTNAFWQRVNLELDDFVAKAKAVTRKNSHFGQPAAAFLAFPRFTREPETGPRAISFGKEQIRSVVRFPGAADPICIVPL